MRSPSSALTLLTATLALAGAAAAQSARQTLNLVSGWNAVWLEVEPVYPAGHAKAGQPKAPADVFPASVVTVISPKRLAGLAEFFAEDPANAGTFNQDGWDQWHNPSSLGDNLQMITGNRAYLIQANANTAVTLDGKVAFRRPVWTPDRYNLVGFGLEGTPTFLTFFGPAGGKHPVDRIFRLNAATGSWQRVTGSATMVSNQAYWVFSSGPSNYMGPVAVDFDGSSTGRLDFGGPSDAVTVDSGIDAKELDLDELTFTNLGSATASPRLELVTNRDPGGGDSSQFELYAVRPTAGTLAYQSVARIDSTPDDSNSPDLQENIPTRGTAAITLGARRLWTTGLAGRTNVYRLKTGAGSLFWLPVSAVNSNLSLPTDLIQGDAPAAAGLWVGEVSVNAATSIVENGAPVRPSAGATPVRILLHSDAAGAVRLLSQVTIMQTKTADPAVPAIPALVVNPAKIPFFEGIRERNGKRVGVRIESVAYDMPRDTSIAAQAESPVDPASDDIVDMIVAESTSPVTRWLSGAGLYPNRAAVDQAAIDSYLLFRNIRPPALKETYLPSLPVSGAVGAGKTVRTNPGTLTLDPFHRSNPFRHAYHQNHPKGPRIGREMEIVFDSAQPAPDRLRGSYRETLSGLTKSNLTVTGAIEMRRVSNVASLN